MVNEKMAWLQLNSSHPIITFRRTLNEKGIPIARGEYKPRKNEPTVWFESTKSMLQIFSTKNQELLCIILEAKPRSITELGELANRKKSNLSRTLKTLEKYGIVELKKTKGTIKPRVKATDFRVVFGLHFSSPRKRETRV